LILFFENELPIARHAPLFGTAKVRRILCRSPGNGKICRDGGYSVRNGAEWQKNLQYLCQNITESRLLQ